MILTNDDTRDLAIQIVDQLVLQGYIEDDMDTDNETEFEIQDLIHEQINLKLQMSNYETKNISEVLDIEIREDISNVLLIDNEFETRHITLSFDELDEIIKQYNLAINFKGTPYLNNIKTENGKF